MSIAIKDFNVDGYTAIEVLTNENNSVKVDVLENPVSNVEVVSTEMTQPSATNVGPVQVVSGPQGPKGDKGPKGDTGATGPEGPAGKDGKSAYEIAVDNDFEGNETEWLASLHGKDGRDGVDGKDGYAPIKGVDYFDGKNGNDGYTPIKGVDYFDGKDGVDGKDGYSPVRGVDYYTEADKAEMVFAVITQLPVYNGEVVIE